MSAALLPCSKVLVQVAIMAKKSYDTGRSYAMQISSRFTIALHILTCVETFRGQYKVTSDFLASSINTHPVVVRKILGQLSRAGLITVARGTGGIEIARALTDVTFYDVYQAVGAVEDNTLFHFHENPNPRCPVGSNIHTLLDEKLRAVQQAMEDKMREFTIADLCTEIERILKQES